MINEKALKRIRTAEQRYKENWGKDVDYTAIPTVISQEILADILERIMDTGESVIVGYNKIKDQNSNMPHKR